MLKTPLGEIEIKIDGNAIPYDFQKKETDKTCPDLDGRFLIKIPFASDDSEHIISCCIKGYVPTENDDPDSGENLELKNFYKGTVKLSIGLLDKKDCGYFAEYSDYGMMYIVHKNTKFQYYYFAIAWIDNANDENEIQTWFGADAYKFELREYRNKKENF